jgi:hypothetical protein
LRFDEDGLFNLDDEGRAEKQICAVAASNVIRNFSFMPDNEVIMAQNRHCMETAFQCIEDHTVGENFCWSNLTCSFSVLHKLLMIINYNGNNPYIDLLLYVLVYSLSFYSYRASTEMMFFNEMIFLEV